MHLRVVEGLWDGGMAVLTGVVHTLQPVIGEVLAVGRENKQKSIPMLAIVATHDNCTTLSFNYMYQYTLIL